MVMAGLASVPVEILSSILDYVYNINLQALITSQRVSRRFHAVIQDILSRQHARPRRISSVEHGVCLPAVNSLLWRNFRPLFAATECFTPEERARIIYLTIEGDNTLPFKRLPWSRDEKVREAFVRPEATWRKLSITQPWQEPITRLEVIRSYTSEVDDTVEYVCVDLCGDILTMGVLYDVLLSDQVHFEDETGEWELLLGKRLRNHDLLQEYECFIPSDRDLVYSGLDARQCAILYVQGAITDDEPDLWPVGHDWKPSAIGTMPRLLSWDGARQRDLC